MPLNTLCLKIANIDRLGLIMDISQILAAYQINIISMEVQPNIAYLEIPALLPEHTERLVKQIKKIPQVTEVSHINLMPHQEQAEQLKTLLASVSDGIISIDQHGLINQYNTAAEKIICLPSEEVIGKHLIDVLSTDCSLLTALY